MAMLHHRCRRYPVCCYSCLLQHALMNVYSIACKLGIETHLDYIRFNSCCTFNDGASCLCLCYTFRRMRPHSVSWKWATCTWYPRHRSTPTLPWSSPSCTNWWTFVQSISRWVYLCRCVCRCVCVCVCLCVCVYIYIYKTYVGETLVF